jgi:hypothetical protein
MTIDFTIINTVSSRYESRCWQLCIISESMAILIDATGTLIPEFPNRSELSTNRTVGSSRITLSPIQISGLDLN